MKEAAQNAGHGRNSKTSGQVFIGREHSLPDRFAKICL
jgi:hypothetical protein